MSVLLKALQKAASGVLLPSFSQPIYISLDFQTCRFTDLSGFHFLTIAACQGMYTDLICLSEQAEIKDNLWEFRRNAPKDNILWKSYVDCCSLAKPTPDEKLQLEAFKVIKSKS